MVEKQNSLELLKISSDKFISNLEKRGTIFNEELKFKLYELELQHKQNNIKREELINHYDIPKNVIELIKIFQILDSHNINYINYILIYENLQIQQLKNFYRYIMIKWNKVKNNIKNTHKYNTQTQQIDNFTFQDIIQNLNKEKNNDLIENIIFNKFKDFFFISDNDFPNMYIIFFVNTLQEYLCPP